MGNPIRQTSAWFTANNPVLLYEQQAIEIDTTLTKYGDGITAYNSLDYSGFKQINNHLEVNATATNGNIEGGDADSTYLITQSIDGGTA
jgi:hypothetical protein